MLGEQALRGPYRSSSVNFIRWPFLHLRNMAVLLAVVAASYDSFPSNRVPTTLSEFCPGVAACRPLLQSLRSNVLHRGQYLARRIELSRDGRSLLLGALRSGPYLRFAGEWVRPLFHATWRRSSGQRPWNHQCFLDSR